MNSRVYAGLLARTYLYRVSGFRPLAEGGETRLCQNAKCALSRSAHTSTPAPADRDGILPESVYRLSLYTQPELWFQLGDRVEVTDPAGRCWRGRTSDSVCYPGHCVTVVEVFETMPSEQFGQDSGETGGEEEPV